MDVKDLISGVTCLTAQLDIANKDLANTRGLAAKETDPEKYSNLKIKGDRIREETFKLRKNIRANQQQIKHRCNSIGSRRAGYCEHTNMVLDLSYDGPIELGAIKRLHLAMIESGYEGALPKYNPKYKRFITRPDDYNWIMSEESELPNSFQYLCNHWGINGRHIRLKLKTEIEKHNAEIRVVSMAREDD